MKYLRLGLNSPTSNRLGILLLLGLSSWLYSPFIYAMAVYFGYFMAWDITSTKDLRIKVLKSFMSVVGYIFGLSSMNLILFFFFPDPFRMFNDRVIFETTIAFAIVYEISVTLFLYIHHFGLHSEIKKY